MATAKAMMVAPTGVGAFWYSNLGYIVAGAAIERITGRTWEDSMANEVFGPLGITSAGYGAPNGLNPWGHRGRRIRGPWLHPSLPVDPGPAHQPNARTDNPPVMRSAGGVHLTIKDWARFIAVLLTDGGELLSPSSIAMIHNSTGQSWAAPGHGWALPDDQTRADYAIGQQGSNTLWAAAALVAPARDRRARRVQRRTPTCCRRDSGTREGASRWAVHAPSRHRQSLVCLTPGPSQSRRPEPVRRRRPPRRHPVVVVRPQPPQKCIS